MTLNRRLTIAHVAVAIYLVVVFAFEFWYRDPHSVVWQILNWVALVYLSACLIAWVVTLIKLYRDVKQSEKVLPNKRVFILHGVVLSAFVLAYALRSIVFTVADSLYTETYEPYTLFGIGDLLILTENTTEIVTFFMVIFLILPL